MHIHHGRLEPLSLNMLNKGAAPNRGSWGLFLANCWLIRFFQEMTIFFQRNICWPCLELASLLFFWPFMKGYIVQVLWVSPIAYAMSFSLGGVLPHGSQPDHVDSQGTRHGIPWHGMQQEL